MATIATEYLFLVANKTEKELKKEFLFLALGVLLSLNIHSFREFLESIGVISIEFLVLLMHVLVLIGNILILIGSITIFNIIQQIRRGILKKNKKGKSKKSFSCFSKSERFINLPNI